MKTRIVNMKAQPDGMDAKFIVSVYRDQVWIAAYPLFIAEAIMTPEQAEKMAAALTELAEEARKS